MGFWIFCGWPLKSSLFLFDKEQKASYQDLVQQVDAAGCTNFPILKLSFKFFLDTMQLNLLKILLMSVRLEFKSPASCCIGHSNLTLFRRCIIFKFKIPQIDMYGMNEVDDIHSKIMLWKNQNPCVFPLVVIKKDLHIASKKVQQIVSRSSHKKFYRSIGEYSKVL